MPTDPKYQYDVFISYKSEDRPWAEKLYDDLQNEGLIVFIDYDRLEAGREWEPQLAVALSQSQHLVVVWSDEADRSGWVRREIGHFDARRAAAEAAGEETDSSRTIFVVLQGVNPAYSSFQMITKLRESTAYNDGAANVEPNLWTEVVGKVETAIGSDKRGEPVLLAVMALTQDRIDEIDADAPHPSGFKSLNELLNDLGLEQLKTLEHLKAHYHSAPQEWQPLGSNKNIWTMLETLRKDINKVAENRKFYWEPIGDAFWGDYENAKSEVERLASNWSVIVIDPLSFYHTDFQYQFGRLYKVWENPRAIFMALPPFGMLMPYVQYRSLIEKMATQVFDRFYDPPRRGTHYARCNVNIVDRLDIKQWLLTTVGSELLIRAEESSHGYLKV